MADITVSTSVNQFTFTLENLSDSNDVVERTLSIEASDSIPTAKAAGQAFVTGYMANFANKADDDTGVHYGSLIQPNNWRDANDNQEAYKCTGIAVTHIKTTKNYFDL